MTDLDAEEMPIIQYWHDESVPDRIGELVRTFGERNPDLRHAIFNRSEAEAFIASHFSEREVAAFRACAVPAMQADYFRYCAVFVGAGIYADADLRCLTSLRALLDEPGVLFGRHGVRRELVRMLYGWPYELGPYQAVGNGFFAFREVHHPLLSTAIEIATANIEQRIADGPRGVWLTAGPGIFTSMYLLRRLDSVDAFIRYSAGTVLEPSARLFCEIVEGPARLEPLFAGVAIRPRAESYTWARPVEVPRPPSGPRVHWMKFKGSIFN